MARKALGLDPEKFTVFVNAGWEGGGNILEIFQELVHGELDVQAIFLAGRNEELRAAAEVDGRAGAFPNQGDWLLRSGRAVDGRGQRDDLKTGRPDDLRGPGLPPADHRRRDHRADAAGESAQPI